MVLFGGIGRGRLALQYIKYVTGSKPKAMLLLVWSACTFNRKCLPLSYSLYLIRLLDKCDSIQTVGRQGWKTAVKKTRCFSFF